MFVVNDDMSVYVTRGDYCNIPVAHQFQSGDMVRFKVTKKKDCNTVVLQRDFVVESATETFVISLTGNDTKIGEVISKPTDYWYEVELNPETNPQTIIGYDEDGAKILKLFPEGKDVDGDDIEVVGTKTLQELVDYALDQANKSGAFDGKDGQDGADGKDGQDGYTPVKGKDYFTEEDKNEIVADVAEEVLPNCTNALKATASGEVVRVDDVSPIEHIAKAKVSGKNLIPTFTQDYSVTRGELTQSCEAGGNTITINGIGNSNGGGRNNFRDFSQHFFLKKGKTYTLSQQTVSGTCDGVFSVYVSKLPDSDSVTWTSNSMVRKTFVAEEDMECYIGVNVVAGVVYNNVVVRFQLEEGDTATEYEPYVDPATVEVTRCGKNLVPYPFYNKTKTENGITFTDKGNGIIAVNGTATDNAFFHFVIDSTMRVKGVYTLSGLSGGSGTTYYIQPFISGTAVRGLTNGSYLYEFDGILDKITMVVTKGTTIDNLEVKLQLEQGNKATDFESYKVEKYTPDAEGTCDIIPVSPTMTLFSNTPGANIKVEYNQDTNKAMEDVRSDLRTLDNAVAELSGGSTLIVTIDEENGTASHNSQQIYDHVQAGGTAVLYHRELYYTLHSCEAGFATFRYYSDDGFVFQYRVWFEGDIEHTEFLPLTYENMDQPVDSLIRQNFSNSVMKVQIDPDTEKATYTSQQIYSHVMNGGSAYLYNHALTTCRTHCCIFTELVNEESQIYQTYVYEDGSVEYFNKDTFGLSQIDSKITAPSTAEVGQTIVVKSVDSDGKPTAWEAVDLPSVVVAKFYSYNDIQIFCETHTAEQLYSILNDNELPVIAYVYDENTGRNLTAVCWTTGESRVCVGEPFGDNGWAHNFVTANQGDYANGMPDKETRNELWTEF